jgi:hypothetical protein
MLAEHEGIDLSRKSVRRISIPQALRNSPTPPASASESSGSIPTRGCPAPVGCQRPRLARGARSAAELGGAIDNSTSLVPWTCFRAQEETHGYFQLMRHVVRRHGIPVAVHSDQLSSFRSAKTAAHRISYDTRRRRGPSWLRRLLHVYFGGRCIARRALPGAPGDAHTGSVKHCALS